MTITQYTIDRYVEALRAGYGFCGGCAVPNISPEEKAWKCLCSVCWNANAPHVYCVVCGNHLEEGRRMYAEENGGTCRRCTYCSMGMTDHVRCHDCKVPHPRSWHPDVLLLANARSSKPDHA